MKIKTLIKKLQKFDPELKVNFCTASGSESGYVTGTVTNDGKKAVCISVVGTHFFGEKFD